MGEKRRFIGAGTEPSWLVTHKGSRYLADNWQRRQRHDKQITKGGDILQTRGTNERSLRNKRPRKRLMRNSWQRRQVINKQMTRVVNYTATDKDDRFIISKRQRKKVVNKQLTKECRVFNKDVSHNGNWDLAKRHRVVFIWQSTNIWLVIEDMLFNNRSCTVLWRQSYAAFTDRIR